MTTATATATVRGVRVDVVTEGRARLIEIDSDSWPMVMTPGEACLFAAALLNASDEAKDD